jgi:hypothetical protein
MTDKGIYSSQLCEDCSAIQLPTIKCNGQHVRKANEFPRFIKELCFLFSQRSARSLITRTCEFYVWYLMEGGKNAHSNVHFANNPYFSFISYI